MKDMTDKEWEEFWAQTVAEQKERIIRGEVDTTPVLASFNLETEVIPTALEAQNLQPPDSADWEGVPLGRWGTEYERYLTRMEPEYYQELLRSGQLECHLRKIDQQGWEMMDRLIPQYAKAQGVTEQLKQTDQLKWVGLMNNIRDQITEVIRETLIYS